MELEVFSDLSERIRYNLTGFPLLARKGEMSFFRRYATACHWHPDLEFIYVLDGDMEYFVNGEIIPVKKGEGIFVNSKRLHYNYTKNNADCDYLTVVIHPSLLGYDTGAGKKYFETAFGFKTENFVLLKSDTVWHRAVFDKMAAIDDEMCHPHPDILNLLARAADLCAVTHENLQADPQQGLNEGDWLTVWNMTGFIQKNYGEKIALEDIAAAGSVCKSQCCKLFSKYIGQTPTHYLTRYRVGKSCEMLQEGNISILEIAMACGFQSPSYFTQVFHKELGVTPTLYRSGGHA